MYKQLQFVHATVAKETLLLSDRLHIDNSNEKGQRNISYERQRHFIMLTGSIHDHRREFDIWTWWRIGKVDDSQPEVRGFYSRSSRHVHVGTFGKSFTFSCLCASA